MTKLRMAGCRMTEGRKLPKVENYQRQKSETEN